jgi:uncharacterized protein YegP (UPF0339 family)
MPQFDAFEDLVGKWRWRLRDDDGSMVATAGESYDTHWHALRAAEEVRFAAVGARVSNEPGPATGDPLSALLAREVSMQ